MLLPPRVLLVGDSIAGEYGHAAASQLGDRYDVVVRAYPGLGLLDRGPRVNVPALLRADLHALHPSVVVAEFSGNYGLGNPPQPGVPLGSQQYFAQWKSEVDAFTREATGEGASVVWLLAPRPIRGRADVSDQLGAIYREEAGHGRVSVLDPTPLVTAYDSAGQLYAADGRHLSAAGVKLVAHLVAQRVEAESRWSLRLRALSHSPLAIAAVVIAVAAVVTALAVPRRGRKTRPRRSPVPIPQ